MNDNERDELKEQLRAMAAGRGDGINLDTPFHWLIEDLTQPVPFFEQLPALLPVNSILYVEGTEIAADVAAFYSSHRARNAVEVVRDTIVPVPDIYHFNFSPEVCATLREFAGKRPVKELFDHIKAYHGETLLFTFHDAFCGWLQISERVPQEEIARFCDALGVSRRREQTKPRDPEVLHRFREMLEHPEEFEIRGKGESWWKRASRHSFKILGVVLVVFGALIAIDGLLPLRSRGPNLLWLEVIAGALLVIAGWRMRVRRW